MNAIVAHDEAYGIGLNNKLAWNLPDDLRFFKEMTKNKICIMGRKTAMQFYDRPLKDRTIICITRNPELEENRKHMLFTTYEGFVGTYSDEELSHDHFMVCGGGEIYRLFEPYINMWYVSKIYGDWGCDTFFDKTLLDNFNLTFEQKMNPIWVVREFTRNI